MPTERVARFSFEKLAAKTGTLTVSVPPKLKEFDVINKAIIDRVGRLTGHRGCLSGGIRVILEEDFSEEIRF